MINHEFLDTSGIVRFAEAGPDENVEATIAVAQRLSLGDNELHGWPW